MIDLDDRVGFEIDLQILEEIKLLYTNKAIELILTDNTEIRELNRNFRAIDKATDVLSFPIENDSLLAGSIVISIDKVKELADELNHSYQNEVTLLFIHALLHLIGYDHENDNGEMREQEEKIIREFNLPKSLIVRNLEE